MIPNTYNDAAFTMSYSYGSADKEYVFSCRGRPFAALVSTNLPTPASSLLDYALVRQLGLKMTDIQCRKFHYAGNKMRILGRVSTAVQCVQNGKICGNFHIKGLVVTDLYPLLDTHCVAGIRMQEKIASLSAPGQDTHDEDEESDEDVFNTSLEDYYPQASLAPAKKPLASPDPALMSSAPGATMTRSSAPCATMTRSSAPCATMTSSSAPGATMTSSSAPSGKMTTSSAPSGKMTPYVTLPLSPAVNRVTDTATILPVKLKLPKVQGLLWETQTKSKDPYRFWLDRCANANEEETFIRSHGDGQPRVIILAEDDYDNPQFLRVGNWDKLGDPARHQAGQVYLAKIRKAEPDRVCKLCNYLLGHNCDLFYPDVVHCKECCTKMQKANKEISQHRQ